MSVGHHGGRDGAITDIEITDITDTAITDMGTAS